MMERPNIYLQKVDSMGNYQWSNIFGSQQSFDFAKSVVQSSDSCYLITGDSDDYGLFLLKTDHTGNFLWEKGYDYDSNVTFGNCIQNTFDDHLQIPIFGLLLNLKFPTGSPLFNSLCRLFEHYFRIIYPIYYKLEYSRS